VFATPNDYDNQLETALLKGKSLTLLLEMKHATKFIALRGFKTGSSFC
jgi:hypothetical protein